MGNRLLPVLDNQRKAALRVRLLGAYLGHGLMLTIASLMATSVWVKVLGAGYLVKLAFDHLGASAPAEGEEVVRPIDNSTFWRVVSSVEIADLIFSLDNVVAAVSLSDKLWVVMLGIHWHSVYAFCSGLVQLCCRTGAGAEEGSGLSTGVQYCGVEIFLEEFAGIEISDLLRFAISVSTVFITLIYSYTCPLHILRPILSWVARGFSRFNAVLDWALEPLFAVPRVFWKTCIWIDSLLRPVKESV